LRLCLCSSSSAFILRRRRSSAQDDALEIASTHVGPDALVWAAEQRSAKPTPYAPPSPVIRTSPRTQSRTSSRRPRRPRLGSRATLGKIHSPILRRHRSSAQADTLVIPSAHVGPDALVWAAEQRSAKSTREARRYPQSPKPELLPA